MIDNGSSLSSRDAVVEGYFAAESAKTLTLFKSEVWIQELQDFLGYHPERIDEPFLNEVFCRQQS